MNNKIKILYIIPAEGFGGAEKQAVLHISHLPSSAIDVSVITGPGNRIMNHFQKHGIAVHHYAHLPTEYGKPFNIISYLLYFGKTILNWGLSIIYIYSIARKEKVNLIFASRVVGWALAGPVSKAVGIPCIWRFGSCVHGRWRKLGLKILTTLFPPNLIISNCRAVTASINEFINSPVVEIPNGVERPLYIDKTEVTRFRKNFNFVDNAPIIGLAARPSPDKGMKFLADVVSKVKCVKSNAHFYIAGEFGWRKQIEDDFERRGLIENVSFLGHIDNISLFFLNCDIIILTSRDKSIEGLPNSLMEAMALGRPVIATNVGGISELIIHEKTGVLVNSEDVTGFSSSIAKLIDNPQKQNFLGKEARSFILDKYAADSIGQSLADAITFTLENNLSIKKTTHLLTNYDYTLHERII